MADPSAVLMERITSIRWIDQARSVMVASVTGCLSGETTMPTHDLAFHRPRSPGARAPSGVAAPLAGWWRAWRDRRELAHLDDHMLRDLGLTRGDLDAALGQPFWQAVDYGALDAARRRSGPRLGAGSR
jgi:uncharacterized protein YjiS (DUF1127 family)